jgi:hypothetical protein
LAKILYVSDSIFFPSMLTRHFQHRVVIRELDLNVVNQWLAAIAVISCGTGKVLRNLILQFTTATQLTVVFAVAVDSQARNMCNGSRDPDGMIFTISSLFSA